MGMVFRLKCRKQRPHFLMVLDSGSVFDTAGNVNEFGMELFANRAHIFGRDAARKPERKIARLWAFRGGVRESSSQLQALAWWSSPFQARP